MARPWRGRWRGIAQHVHEPPRACGHDRATGQPPPPGNVPVPLRSACVAPVRSLSHVAEGDELSVRGQDAAGSGMVPSPPVPGGVGQDLAALPLRAGRHRWPIRPRHPPPGPARRWPWPTAQPGQEPAQFLQRLRLPLQLQQGWSWDPVHPPPDPVHPPPPQGPPHPGTPRSPDVVRPQADLQLAQDLGRLLHPPPELLGAEQG